jgi:Tfp pilus assembly protein PilO
MTRLIIPIILIGIAGAFFFMFTNPLYNNISTLNLDVASYNGALDNSKMFENERDKLTSKYNQIDPDNLVKIKKLLPDNVDNIRLILEIGQIALPYGMVLKDVKYNVTDSNTATTPTTETVIKGGTVSKTSPNYGIFDLEFSISGTYNNFISFTKDLESNLRIVDISSITFSSNTGSAGSNPKISSSDIYKYNFKIKTYFLKN